MKLCCALRTLPVQVTLQKSSKHCQTLAACLHTSTAASQWQGVFHQKPSKLRGKQYDDVFKRSIDDVDRFWGEMASNITWFSQWNKVLDVQGNYQKWFAGGTTNTCYNAVDRHVESGQGETVAIIHDSPVTGSQERITYSQLLDQVSRFAGVLRSNGVNKGDRVVIYLPMIPQAIVVMLACARIGAVHSLVFGGFSAKELSTRIAHCQPKLVVTASCGVEPSRTILYTPIVNEALQRADCVDKCRVIVYNRPQLPSVELLPGQLCYDEQMNQSKPVDCLPVESNDPLYILYTSGTTGNPKGVVRSHGGHAVVLTWSMKNVYGLNPGEVWWSASDLGWIVGHSYICYAPLLNGNTTIIYEGKPVGTPDSGAFFRVLSEHNVASMFVAPTALRAIRKVDPNAERSKKYNLDKFRVLFVAGEHCDIETLHWCKDVFKRPVLDNWWQTETGWPITSTCLGLGNSDNPPDGTTGLPVPGWNVRILRPDGSEASVGELGNIVVKQPLPPSFALMLYNNEGKYQEYFQKYPGYYDTADSGFIDEHGYISVMARTDDIINVAGHRLSTSALEEAIMMDNAVAECAVVGLKDSLKGHVPLGFCVLSEEHKNLCEEEHRQRIISCVRDHVGPVAAFKLVVFVPALPKTRSGKIPRATLAALSHNEQYKIPATIEDPTVYDKILGSLQTIGLPLDKTRDTAASCC